MKYVGRHKLHYAFIHAFRSKLSVNHVDSIPAFFDVILSYFEYQNNFACILILFASYFVV
jgi:hypothetical protein